MLVLGVGGPLVAIRQTQLANDARVSEDKAKERLRERNAMLVRTLLAPVGDHEGVISPFEHRAFLDLAALEEDDLRLRFLAAGLAFLSGGESSATLLVVMECCDDELSR